VFNGLCNSLLVQYVLSVVPKAVTKEDQTKQSSATLSVTQTMTNLCTEIKSAMKAEVCKKGPLEAFRSEDGSDPVREIFSSFDTDGNGVLDCKEMLIACQQLDLDVTEEQLNVVWPMLDADGSGEVDIEEFFAIITHHDVQLESEKKVMTTNQRRKRIQERTDMANYFIEVSNNIRIPVVAHMRETKQSSTDFFRIIDEDGSGDIDKEELLHLLVRLKISVTMNELHLAFAAMDADEDGGISEKEWNKFIKGGKKWEMKHTEKMQQTKYLKRLQQIMMQPEA